MSQFRAAEDKIDLNNVLDLNQRKESLEILQSQVERLSHGGVISMRGIDFGEISRLFNSLHISIDDVNKMFADRKSFSSLESRCSELEQLGLIIIKKIPGPEYYVEAKRK